MVFGNSVEIDSYPGPEDGILSPLFCIGFNSSAILMIASSTGFGRERVLLPKAAPFVVFSASVGSERLSFCMYSWKRSMMTVR